MYAYFLLVKITTLEAIQEVGAEWSEVQVLERNRSTIFIGAMLEFFSKGFHLGVPLIYQVFWKGGKSVWGP